MSLLAGEGAEGRRGPGGAARHGGAAGSERAECSGPGQGASSSLRQELGGGALTPLITAGIF